MNLCTAVMGTSICDPGRDRSLSISLVTHCLWTKFNSDPGQKDTHIAPQTISLRPDAPWLLDMEEDPNYWVWYPFCPGCHILFFLLARVINMAFSTRCVPMWHDKTRSSLWACCFGVGRKELVFPWIKYLRSLFLTPAIFPDFSEHVLHWRPLLTGKLYQATVYPSWRPRDQHRIDSQ